MKIKYIILCLIFIFQTKAFANEYTTEDAIELLVPYNDNHVMYREECMKILNRVIGINNIMIMQYLDERYDGYTHKNDIKYNTYMGRFTDIGLHLYDYIIPTRENNFFMVMHLQQSETC